MGVAQNLSLKTLQDETLDTLKKIADALNGEAGIVDTLTEKIANAKTEAVQTAEEDATSKANAAKDEAVKKAKAEATQYTNSKLENYYTKTDVDENQQKQDARIAALEAARPTSGAGALYDFSKAEAVKTGETIKLADGTVKDIYRLCVERENVQDNFSIQTAGYGDITKIIKIAGTATRDNGATEDTSHLIQPLINNVNETIDINIIEKNTVFNFLISVYFIV